MNANSTLRVTVCMSRGIGVLDTAGHRRCSEYALPHAKCPPPVEFFGTVTRDPLGVRDAVRNLGAACFWVYSAHHDKEMELSHFDTVILDCEELK